MSYVFLQLLPLLLFSKMAQKNCLLSCALSHVPGGFLFYSGPRQPVVNSRRQSRWKSAVALNLSTGPLLQSQFPPTWLAGPSLSVRLLHPGGHHPLARLSAESAPPPGATQNWAANGRQETQPRQRGWRTFWLLSACRPPLSLTSASHSPNPVGNYLVRELLGKEAYGDQPSVKWNKGGRERGMERKAI